MTSDEIGSLKIAACCDSDQEDIEFIDPLYIDDDFVVVEQKMFAWFLLFSLSKAQLVKLKLNADVFNLVFMQAVGERRWRRKWNISCKLNPRQVYKSSSYNTI